MRLFQTLTISKVCGKIVCNCLAASLFLVGSNISAHAIDPTDPDYIITKSMIERYQCVNGFNSGLFVNRALTDEEFAAVLRVCASDIRASAQARSARRDLAQLDRLEKTYLGPNQTAATATMPDLENNNSENNAIASNNQTLNAIPKDDNVPVSKRQVTPAQAAPRRTNTYDHMETSKAKAAPKRRLWGGIGSLMNNPKITFNDLTTRQYPDLDRNLVLDAGLEIYANLQPIKDWQLFYGGRALTVGGDYTQHKNVGTSTTGTSNGNISHNYLALHFTLEKQTPIDDIDGTLGFGFGAGPLFTNLSGTFNADGVNAAAHLEIFYRLKVVENISVAPVLTAIIPAGSPDGNKDSNASATSQSSILVGTVRVVFEF